MLLTGASGYLGQHLLWSWMQQEEAWADDSTETIIVALYFQNPSFSESVLQHVATSSRITVIPRVCNLIDPSSVDALMQEYTSSFDVCVHTAALSSPHACQQDPAKARAINVPEYLFSKLNGTRIIALSTDQVFDGTMEKLYVENEDVPRPLNVYGTTKLEMEQVLMMRRNKEQHKQGDIVLLRSSIILGPKAPITHAHDTFLHFCASRQGQETTFFIDEYRTVVSVQHICRVITFMVKAADTPVPSGIYHMGGPIKVNRLELAQAVFEYLGYDPHGVLVAAKQTNPTSPLDIGMDSGKLERATKIVHEPSTLRGMVEETLGISRR